MNIKELKELIRGLSDDALVVVSGRDHDFRVASASLGTAIATTHPDKPLRHLDEDYGDDHFKKCYGREPHARIVGVVVVG